MSIKQDLIDAENYAAQQRRKMGAKKYEQWVKFFQTKKYTPFKSISQLEKYLIGAGYDIKTIQTFKYTYIKTHLKNDEVYWHFEEDKIVATFPSHIDKKLLNKFISDVETLAGQKCFFDTDVSTDSVQYSFPTIITDTYILRNTLKKLHFDFKENKNSFALELDTCSVTLQFSTNKPYDFLVNKCSDLKEVHKYFNMIEMQYQKALQKNICNKIKDKLATSSAMHLEQEELLEDNSILLTISI